MAVTTIWDPTAPDGATVQANTVDTVITTFKAGVQERVRNGGMLWGTASGLNTLDGRICAGLQGTNTLTLYETNATDAMMGFNDSTRVLTLGDGVTGARRYGIIALGSEVRGVTNMGTATAATVAATDRYIYSIVTTRATDYVVTLPAASAGPRLLTVYGQQATVATYDMLLAPAGTDTINSATGNYSITSVGLRKTGAATVISDGTSNWLVMSVYRAS